MAHAVDEVARAGEQSQRLTIAFLVLAWFFVFLRTWTRTWIIASFGWDDATMILASMIFTIFAGSQLYIEANGGGTHVTSFEKLQELTKWVVVSESTYLVAMMAVKISLGIFFARIVVAQWHIMLIYVTLGVNVVSSAAAFFYVIFRCGHNVDRYALQQLKNQCAPRGLDRFMAYQSAVFTTLTDLVFVVLPVIVLWNANMDRRSKFSVGFILCLAASACICSMIRFQYVDGLTQIDDFFWNATNIAIWSTIECGASIIAGCLATLRPLLKRMYTTAGTITKSLRSSTSQSNSSSRRTDRSTSTTTRVCSNERRGTSRNDYKPTCTEAIELSNNAGSERESQDRILHDYEQSAMEVPWPARIVEDITEPVRSAPLHSKHKTRASRQQAKACDDALPRHSSASPPSVYIAST